MKQILSYSPNVEYTAEETHIERLLLRLGEKFDPSDSVKVELGENGFSVTDKTTYIRHMEYILVYDGDESAIFRVS